MKNRLNVTLWTVQALVAALFLFAGVMKLILPIDAMAGPVSFPGWFLRFLGVAETLGGLGLILPGLFRIRTGLTPLAASCLVVIMIGATTVTLMGGGGVGALFPAAVGLLCGSVAFGRTWLVPLSARRRPAAGRMRLSTV